VPEIGNRKKERIVSGENNVVSPLGSGKQIHLMIRNEFVARFGSGKAPVGRISFMDDE